VRAEMRVLNLARSVSGARASARGSLVGSKRRVFEPAQPGFDDCTWPPTAGIARPGTSRCSNCFRASARHL